VCQVGTVVSSLRMQPRARMLLLIRLFQPATSCSVRVWRARHFRRICANFSVNSQQRTPANSISLRAAGRTGSAVHDVDTDEPT